MNTTQNEQQDIIIQNNVPCPKKSPWSIEVSYLTMLTFPLIIALAFYIFLQTSMIKLAIWSAGLFILAVPLRYLICTRCPYYGQNCSLPIGKIFPYLFKNKEGKPMLPLGLWMDGIMFFFLFIFPIKDAWEVGGILLVFIWGYTNLTFVILLTRLGCTACPFTFCPFNNAAKTFWGMFDRIF